MPSITTGRVMHTAAPGQLLDMSDEKTYLPGAMMIRGMAASPRALAREATLVTRCAPGVSGGYGGSGGSGGVDGGSGGDRGSGFRQMQLIIIL